VYEDLKAREGGHELCEDAKSARANLNHCLAQLLGRNALSDHAMDIFLEALQNENPTPEEDFQVMSEIAKLGEGHASQAPGGSGPSGPSGPSGSGGDSAETDAAPQDGRSM